MCLGWFGCAERPHMVSWTDINDGAYLACLDSSKSPGCEELHWEAMPTHKRVLGVELARLGATV